MKKLSCEDKIRLIYTTQLMEDVSMTWKRALTAHAKVCIIVDCYAKQRFVYIPEIGLGKKRRKHGKQL